MCYDLIKEVNTKNNIALKIGLYEVRHHKTGKYDCCWYLGFMNREEEIYIILRFEIWESKICILFQSAENMPEDMLKYGEKADPNYNNWMPVLYHDYDEEHLVKMLVRYLKNVNENWKKVIVRCEKRRPCGDHEGKVISC